MKNILKKLHTIQKAVEHMEKDGRNTFQNYNYLSETQVTLEMKKLLDENGVLFTHGSKIINTYEISPTSKGTRQFVVNIEVNYKFYDIDSGEFVEGVVVGQGSDTADKGVYKAITGAIKYVFMKNFMIPTGDDPEKTSHEEKKEIPPKKEPAETEEPKSAITVAQSLQKKIGDVFNLMAIIHDTTERKTAKGVITDYKVHDTNSETRSIISKFDKTQEGIKQGDVVLFKDVKVNTFKGELTFLAHTIEKIGG